MNERIGFKFLSRVQWWSLMNTIMNLRKTGNLLSSWAVVSYDYSMKRQHCIVMYLDSWCFCISLLLLKAESDIIIILNLWSACVLRLFLFDIQCHSLDSGTSSSESDKYKIEALSRPQHDICHLENTNNCF